MPDKKEKKENLPEVNVPNKYKPYEKVSVERKNQKYFVDMDDTEEK